MTEFGDSPLNNIPQSSSWNPYSMISYLGNRYPSTDVFPSTYLPSSYIGFVDEFTNTMIDIQAYSALALGIAGIGLTGMTAALALGIPEGLAIKYSRLGNGGAITATQGFTDARPSPRVGLQLGNLFKHQAYIGLSIFSAGQGQFGQAVVWYSTTGWASMEYCTNSAFKKVYLSHGKLASTRIDTSDPNNKKVYVQVSTSSTPPPKGFLPNSKLMVWSNRIKPASSSTTTNWAPQVFKIKSVLPSWEVEIEVLTPPAPPAEPQYFVETGDFFAIVSSTAAPRPGNLVVDSKTGRIGRFTGDGVNFYGSIGAASSAYEVLNPWIMEDPATMHEYGLNTTRAVPETDEQKYGADTSVIGLWLPPLPNVTTLAAPTADSSSSSESSNALFGGVVAYVDEKFHGDVWLPASVADARRRGEWTGFGGDMLTGAKKLAASKMESARLIVSGLNTKRYQNFAAGCLLNEYVIFNGQLYPVIEHPRLDSIEVAVMPVNGTENILPALAVESGKVAAGLIQPNFWLINEMYPSDPGSTGNSTCLWKGLPDSVSVTAATATTPATTRVAWKSRSVPLSRMSSDERKRWGVNSLDLRTLVNIDAGAGSIAAYPAVKDSDGTKYIIKNPKWRLLNRSTGNHYPISNIEVTVSGSPGQEKLALVADIQNQGGIATSNTVAILHDIPYTRVSSGLDASFFAFAEFKAALGSDTAGAPQTWKIAMNGWYDMGRYSFENRIDPATRFSLVDFSFGYDPQQGFFVGGRPAIFATTRRTDTSLTMCEHSLSKRQHVFYDDPDNNSLLVMRSADTDWANQVEQSAVCIGYPMSTGSALSATPADADILLNPGFNVPSEKPVAGSQFSAYWLRIKNAFYQTRITGRGGVNTPLFRRYGLTSPITSSSGAHLPFEFYAPVGSANATLETPAFMPASTSLSDIGLVQVNSVGPPASVLGGSDPPASGGIAPSVAQYALQAQTIRNAHSKEVVYTNDGRMLLAYAGKLPKHIFPGGPGFVPGTTLPGGSTNPVVEGAVINESDAVFLICSEDEGQRWGSPRLKRPPEMLNSSDADLMEWSRALAVMFNFRFAGSVFDKNGNRLLLFGYVYENNHANNNVLSLAMYGVSLATLKLSNTYPVKPTADSLPVAYMRIPQIVAPSPDETVPDKFIGPPKPGVGSICGLGDEMFIKIIGNSGAKALLSTQASIQPDLIFPYMDDTIIRIMVQDNSTGNITGLFSTDRGRTWSGDGVIYARNSAKAPYYFAYGNNNLFFYFQGNTLYSKRVALQPSDAAGKSSQSQVLYDTAIPSVVTTDAAPQKIVVKQNAAGILSVHYIRVNGELGASMSFQSGERWEPMKNW